MYIGLIAIETRRTWCNFYHTSLKRQTALDDPTLGLLNVDDVDVLPHDDPENSKGPDGGASNEQVFVCIAISMLNCQPSR